MSYFKVKAYNPIETVDMYILSEGWHDFKAQGRKIPMSLRESLINKSNIHNDSKLV